MFWISRKNLMALLEEAFRHGQSGSADLNSEVIQDLLIKAKPGKLVFKLQTIAQLQKIQPGKKIIHPLLGEGEVVAGSTGPVIVFNGRVETLNHENTEFWSYPVSINNSKY